MDKLRKELSVAYDQTFSYNNEGDPEAFINVLHQIFKDILENEGLLLFNSLLIERGSLAFNENLSASPKSLALEESKERKLKSLHQTNVRDFSTSLLTS